MGPYRIGVDAGLACSRRPTGVEHYARSLLEELFRLESPEVLWHVYLPPRADGLAVPPGVRVRARPMKAKMPWFVWQTCRDRLDVLYTCGHTLPAGCRGRRVITIYDTIYDRFPECYRPGSANRSRRRTAAALRRAARVVTPSDATRADLATGYGYPPNRIDVIAAGARPLFRPQGTPRDGKLPEGVREVVEGGPFFLAVGRLNLRKNLERVIDAYRLLRRGTACGSLVIAGPDHYGAEALRGRLGDGAEPGERIVFSGYVEEEELAALYRAAAALVYPSLAEGFGLPVLEAMASGTPVITSDVSSMPEVAGEAALLVDPLDTEALAGAMARVLGEPGLAPRLRELGLARAREFSWRRTAERLRDSLLRAAEERE